MSSLLMRQAVIADAKCCNEIILEIRLSHSLAEAVQEEPVPVMELRAYFA